MKIAIGKLTIDYNLYPRAQVDEQHVDYLAEAYHSGAVLPPIVVEKKSLRIVDGVNRVKACEKLWGPAHQIDVLYKTYKNDLELLLDAGRYNSHHGRRMSPFDCAHMAIKAISMGAQVESVAQVLSMRVEKLQSLLNRRVTDVKSIRSVRDGEKKGRPTQVLKNTIRHMSDGPPLTREQSEVNKKLGGMNQLFYVNQIIMLIEADLLDTENEGLMDRLVILEKLLKGLHRKAA